MTVGIESFGVHLPRLRLPSAEVAGFWGSRPSGSVRTVSNWDEDSITMSVEAGARCLKGVDLDSISTVIVASTTFPYVEKQAAALVAEALGFPEAIDTMDVASSMRGATQALKLAIDRTAATEQRVLVIASDDRTPRPEAPDEQSWGHAAVAALVGPDPALELSWVDRSAETWLSTWRRAGAPYVEHADARFSSMQTAASLRRGLEAGVKAAADAGVELRSAAIATANPKDIRGAMSGSGLPDDVTVVGPDTLDQIGYPGAAASFLVLVDAVERAGSGHLVWSTFGDGSETAVVEIKRALADSGLSEQLATSRELTYAQYLRIAQVIEDEPVVPFSSEIQQWRDNDRTARLLAARCRNCGHVAYPPQPACAKCQTHGQFEAHALARSGTIYTFTVEHLYPNPQRHLAMAVVELDDGVRFYCPVTDTAADELEVGAPVDLVYRRVHIGGGFVNYFWKARVSQRKAA